MRLVIFVLFTQIFVAWGQNLSTLLNDVCCEFIGENYNYTSVCCPTKDDYNISDVKFDDDLLHNEKYIECCSIVKPFILPQPRSLPQKFDSLRQAANGFYTFLKAAQKQNKANISIIFKVNEDKETEIDELRRKIDQLTKLYEEKLGHTNSSTSSSLSPPMKISPQTDSTPYILIACLTIILLIFLAVIFISMNKKHSLASIRSNLNQRQLPTPPLQNNQRLSNEYEYISYNCDNPSAPEVTKDNGPELNEKIQISTVYSSVVDAKKEDNDDFYAPDNSNDVYSKVVQDNSNVGENIEDDVKSDSNPYSTV